jgi:hypothetical protein
VINSKLVDPLDFIIKKKVVEESELKDKISFCPVCQKKMVVAKCQGILVDACTDHNIVMPKV